MKNVILLILTLTFYQVSGQQKVIDSLKKELNNHLKEDTIRATILNNISLNYGEWSPEEGLIYADSSINLSTRISSDVKLATAHFAKGYNFAELFKNHEAIAEYEKSFILNKKLDRQSACASIRHNISSCYMTLGNLNEALKNEEVSLTINRKLNDKKGEAISYFNVGLIFTNFANYPKALDNYLNALKIFEEIKDTIRIGKAYTNIGIFYKDWGYYDKAIEYQQKALNIFMKNNSPADISKTYNNLGVVYDMKNDPKKAIEYYNKALKINEELESNYGIASSLGNMGISQISLMQYDEALTNLLKAEEIFNNNGDVGNAIVMMSARSEIYANAPVSLLRKSNPSFDRFSETVSLKMSVLKSYRAIGNLNGEGEVWENLSSFYASNGKFEAALDAYKHFTIIKDSIFNETRDADIDRKLSEYEFEKKEAITKAENEKKQAIANAEIDKQKTRKNTILGGSIFLGLASLGGFVSYKRRRDLENKKTESDFKATVSDTEMKALRSQMNPHFIFNSLNSISDFVNKNDAKAADAYLAKFASLMRQILENSDMKEVTLADDLKALENYMQLEALRLQNKFNYKIEVDEDIDPENILIPPLLLQPFVENSIWHGLADKKENGKIIIRISKEGEMINCVVEDNGIGRSASNAQKSGSRKSIGMNITKSRIDILNRIKKTSGAVRLHDLAEGLRVEVKLPLILNF